MPFLPVTSSYHTLQHAEWDLRMKEAQAQRQLADKKILDMESQMKDHGFEVSGLEYGLFCPHETIRCRTKLIHMLMGLL